MGRARLATDCVARLAVGELHPGWNDADYEAYWQTPDIVAANQCQGCHQADPFIHSPWADQLKHPENPAETLVPVLAGPTNPRPPYFIVGEEFSQPITAGLPDNRCTTCHRPACDNRFAMPSPCDSVGAGSEWIGRPRFLQNRCGRNRGAAVQVTEPCRIFPTVPETVPAAEKSAGL